MKSEADRFKAISEVSVVINSSFDIRASLNLLLEKLIQQMEVDAAAVFTLDPATERLNLVVGNGFQATQDELAVLGADDLWIGRVVLERKLIKLPDLKEVNGESTHAALMGREGFTGYCGVPLLAKGHVVGVLEFFSRTPLPDDPRWQEFLELMGGQAAIAIDNARTFENLQRTNFELTKAYDATMEGWAHALELRDMETGGKSRRVTELSLMFARMLGISGENLINLQYLDLGSLTIKTLKGIEKLINLKYLDCSNCKNLISLDGIEKLVKLEYLHCQGTQIANYSKVSPHAYIGKAIL